MGFKDTQTSQTRAAEWKETTDTLNDATNQRGNAKVVNMNWMVYRYVGNSSESYVESEGYDEWWARIKPKKYLKRNRT